MFIFSYTVEDANKKDDADITSNYKLKETKGSG